LQIKFKYGGCREIVAKKIDVKEKVKNSQNGRNNQRSKHIIVIMF